MNLGTAVASAIVLVAVISFFARSRKRRIPNKWTEIGHISHLRIYPLKSGKGIACESLTCTETGVAMEHARDRMFLVVDSHGKYISGREYPRITQIAAEVHGSRLKLSGLGINPLEMDIPSTGVPVRLRIWGASAEGIDCGREASEWLTTYLGSETPLRLLYRGENVAAKDYIPHMKKLLKMTDTVTYKTDTGLFSDTFSYHLISESSIRDLNSRMGAIQVTPFHFRPNIVVSGEKLIPFEEDRWNWLKIGDVIFQFLAPCMRCSFTKIDPGTGARLQDDQPVSALKRFSSVRDEGSRFGTAALVVQSTRDSSSLVLGWPTDKFFPLEALRKQSRSIAARRKVQFTEWKDHDKRTPSLENDERIKDEAADMDDHLVEVEEGRHSILRDFYNPEKSDAKDKVKRHSIHGMMEEENVIRPHQEMAQLSLDEKKFLLAVERGDVASTRSMEEKRFLLTVERGDVATTRRMLQKAQDTEYININCVDPLGRSALLMAIDNENLEMVELLIEHKVETKDALLHAISEEFVEAVEVLLDHENTIHKPGEPRSWEALPPDTATFTPDITPLILAAHRDNYEIIKILLDRGATLPDPHHVRCGCSECVTSRQEDSLRHSRSRINAYRALASPSLIALSSKDPILTAFELSWELRRLSFMEHEFKIEYQELRKQCQDFATALLDHTRSSYELEVLLNHDPTGPTFEHGERMHLNRLKLAIKLRQKKFVAHPNVQQLLASIWYEGLPGFRRKNMILQAFEIVRIGILFPFFSLMYILAPHSEIGQTMRKPFIKFICHSASYFTFLFLLILASQRIETVLGDLLGLTNDTTAKSLDITTKRGALPSIVEWFILFWVAGLIWSEVKQLWDVGLEEYVHDMWNVIDFVTMSLYVATAALRIVAYYRVQKEIYESTKEHGHYTDLQREEWDTWDPMLIAEGLFSAANIFSSLKLVYIFSVNPYLGPLQVSLSRMVLDIMKFFFLYVLVLFAFSCGLNQLLWYYADMEKKKCVVDIDLPKNGTKNASASDRTACLVWRRFSNLFETTQTLFWAVFGLVDLDSFELEGIKTFTRFWGMLMFGTYSVINIVVLLNLLIAMMNHSYQLISERADVEWKFARSKLWISYFEEGGTVPPPFNIIPTFKSAWYFIRWVYRKLCGHSRAAKKEHMRTIRSIMRNLVRRYVTVEQRKAESQGVTEDDVNEIKQDISAFRCELIEILKNSGMNTSTASGMGTGSGGKKNRQKERRLMKGFNIVPTPSGAPLAPVAEFIASLQAEPEVTQHHDLFGSTISGILGGSHTLPKKSHPFHMSLHGSPAPQFSQSKSLGTPSSTRKSLSKFTPKLHISKRGSGHKRRWGTLIDAAKSGKVSKLINRSRSEDSVCNSNPYQNSTSPDENITESDSNPSLGDTFGSSLSNFGFGQAGPLSVLRRKRKKFSGSRVKKEEKSTNLTTISGGYPGEKMLKRASSVPVRNTEPQSVRFIQVTPEEKPVVEEPTEPVKDSETAQPSTSANAQPSTQAFKSRNGTAMLANLPGIQPVSGHNISHGWL